MAQARAMDVVVSGGGIVGLAALRSLQLVSKAVESSRRPPLNIGLVDKLPRPQHSAPVTKSPALLDGASSPISSSSSNTMNIGSMVRTVALTPASSCILNSLGAWSSLPTKHPYYRMAIRHEQHNSPLKSAEETSSFMSSLLGASKSAAPLIEFTDVDAPLGHIVYNDDVQSLLLAGIEHSLRPGVESVSFGSSLDETMLPSKHDVAGQLVTAKLQPTGERITASLLVACEGANTLFRSAIGSPVLRHDYHQHAFVCSVETEGIDDGNPCCFQNFFLDGSIVGYLPTGPRRANIVFSTSPQLALKLNSKESSDADIVRELNARLCDFAPRDIPRIASIVGDGAKRATGSFPLALSVATQPSVPRCVLIGDSAHGVHPMAGQGLNLGLYDVCVLADLIHKAHVSGCDLGSMTHIGAPLAGSMLAHTAPVIAAMESIKSLSTWVPAVACLGMKLVNSVPFATREIAKAAGGELFMYMHKDSFLLSKQQAAIFGQDAAAGSGGPRAPEGGATDAQQQK